MGYQDYFIKDGKFIGEFEKMYQECDDPWHQIEEANISYSRADTVNSIHRFKLRNVLEVGCGLGYFTAYLQEHCHDSVITGMDISDTAIKKAKLNFPKLSFFQGNLNGLDEKALKPYDGIVFSEIMWCILDDLEPILKQLKSVGGVLIVNQTFYKGEIQKYGREYFTNQDEMIRYIGWNVLAKTFAEISDNPLSYETHTVFKV